MCECAGMWLRGKKQRRYDERREEGREIGTWPADVQGQAVSGTGRSGAGAFGPTRGYGPVVGWVALAAGDGPDRAMRRGFRPGARG